MKLRQRFSIVALITSIFVIVLTVVTISGSKHMLDYKDYQYRQTETKEVLSEMISYLDEVDYWGFYSENAYREWDLKVKTVENNFEYLINDKITKSFSKNFQDSLVETKNLWTLLQNRFSPIEEELIKMENKKLDQGITTHSYKDGIRSTAARFPDNADIQEMLEYVEVVHAQIPGVRRCYTSLAQVTARCSVMLEDVIKKQEKLILAVSISFAVLVSVFLAVFIVLITNGIARRIIKLRDVSKVLAEKDFTASITPSGSEEVKSLMANIDNMIHQVNSFFKLVKKTAGKAISSGEMITDSTTTVTEATNGIGSNIEEMDMQFKQISNAVERTINVMAEMDVQVDTLVENNSNQNRAIADSNGSVSEVVNTLEYINVMAAERTKSAEEMNNLVEDGDRKIAATSKILNDITTQLDEINGVVEIINSVANKTNLLSMNAAIESAHAGDAGKGFAVVAGEIRTLSDATTVNAEKIGTVISNIVTSVTEANKSSLEASKAFEKVSKNTKLVVTSLKEISDAIGKMDQQMHQIKINSEETASAADMINDYCGALVRKQAQVSDEVDIVNQEVIKAMSVIEQIKSETEAIVEKIAAVNDATKENSINMNELENMLEDFKTTSDEVPTSSK